MESNSNPLTTETQSILPLVTSDTFTPAHQNQQGAGLFSVEEQLIQDTLARASEWKVSRNSSSHH